MNNARYFRSETPLTNLAIFEDRMKFVESNMCAALSILNIDTWINVGLKNDEFYLLDVPHIPQSHERSCSKQNLETIEHVFQHINLSCSNHSTIIRPPIIDVVDGSSNIVNQVQKIQRYLDELGYNHLGFTFFQVKKTFSIRRLHLLARDMINEGLHAYQP